VRLVLVGGGGHASDILGALEAIEANGGPRIVSGIVADAEIDMSRFKDRGVRQIGTIDDLSKLDVTHFVAAVGYPVGRKAVAIRAEAAGLKPYCVIHPSAWAPTGVAVGPGAVILARACISPGAVIGSHAMISNMAIIGHDCRVGDYVSVMPGAAVSGDTHLDEGCLIGTNAAVIEKRRVGAWATVGAGAVVVSDIPPNVTAMGAPARF